MRPRNYPGPFLQPCRQRVVRESQHAGWTDSWSVFRQNTDSRRCGTCCHQWPNPRILVAFCFCIPARLAVIAMTANRLSIRFDGGRFEPDHCRRDQWPSCSLVKREAYSVTEGASNRAKPSEKGRRVRARVSAVARAVWPVSSVDRVSACGARMTAGAVRGEPESLRRSPPSIRPRQDKPLPGNPRFA